MAKSIDNFTPTLFYTRGYLTCFGTSWKKWKNKFNIYVQAANITGNIQCKTLLISFGVDDFLELFETLPKPDNLPHGTTKYQKARVKLYNNFLPQPNKCYE